MLDSEKAVSIIQCSDIMMKLPKRLFRGIGNGCLRDTDLNTNVHCRCIYS